MLFWLILVVFLLLCVFVTAIILIQEPKNGGMGDALGGGGGMGGDFGTAGGTAGGLHRLTIILSVMWGVLALLLGIIPR